MEANRLLDWDAAVQLLPIVTDLRREWKAKESVDLHDAISRIAAIYGIENVDAFVEEKLHEAMETGLSTTFDPAAAEKLAAIFASGCAPITKQVFAFAQREISGDELVRFLEELRRANAGQIEAILQEMIGVSGPDAQMVSEAMGPFTVSIYCFAATAKIYQAASRDLALAEERRAEAERLCDETIAQLKAEKAEMNEMVNTYLLDRILPFSDGVQAMDQAVLENDDDGFIRANADLWQLFGRDAQYRSAEEFDALMVSDETFKL